MMINKAQGQNSEKCISDWEIQYLVMDIHMQQTIYYM